jgi:glycosyltransferase involved in cell wall biosynthesis
MEQWADILEAQGVKIDFQSFECQELHSLLYQRGRTLKKVSLVMRAFARRLRLMRRLGDYDAIYVFREAALLGPPVFERWIHRSGVPMIFDFDDAVFVPYVSPSNGYLSLLKFPSKTKTICRLSSHVMAGNSYLAKYASEVNERVTIVPTTIDTDKYAADPNSRSSEPPVIGWSGSYSTVQHLDTLQNVFRRLARREQFRLSVIGAPGYRLDGVDVEVVPWRAGTEVSDLSRIDIGVMPLPDDEWSRGKCGLKALQYMALGIPTVCSPVGVNTEIILDGRNGLIASTEEEWIDRLVRLLKSPDLRAQLGRAGRATVEARYSASSQAARVLAVLESVVSRPVERGQALSTVTE